MCCGAGTAADTEHTTQLIASKIWLHSLATRRAPRVATALNMLKHMLFRYQGHVSAALVLGGVDFNGPHLYTVYPHGMFCFSEGNFVLQWSIKRDADRFHICILQVQRIDSRMSQWDQVPSQPWQFSNPITKMGLRLKKRSSLSTKAFPAVYLMILAPVAMLISALSHRMGTKSFGAMRKRTKESIAVQQGTNFRMVQHLLFLAVRSLQNLLRNSQSFQEPLPTGWMSPHSVTLRTGVFLFCVKGPSVNVA